VCIKDLPPGNGLFLSFFLPFFPPHGVFFYFGISSIYLSIVCGYCTDYRDGIFLVRLMFYMSYFPSFIPVNRWRKYLIL